MIEDNIHVLVEWIIDHTHLDPEVIADSMQEAPALETWRVFLHRVLVVVLHLRVYHVEVKMRSVLAQDEDEIQEVQIQLLYGLFKPLDVGEEDFLQHPSNHLHLEDLLIARELKPTCYIAQEPHIDAMLMHDVLNRDTVNDKI